MKRKCLGCKAMELDKCQLGHPMRHSGGPCRTRYHPTEECEKPTTTREFVHLLHKLKQGV